MYRKSNPNVTALSRRKDAKRTPFAPQWQILRKIDDNLILLYKQGIRKNSYAALYIHTLRFRIPRTLSKTEQFYRKYPNPQAITNVGDKLRHYRYQKALFQKDVAKYLGIDRTTYNYYEMGVRECPLDILKKLAEILEVEVTDLMDEYNLFLFNGQGRQVRKIRKSMGLTQREFAGRMGVSTATIKQWESERVRVMRSVFEKMMQISNGTAA